MNKTVFSAFTAALVAGAASTAFAAANPFTDVPADHWAYDAVAQLAADGIVDGYGDGTFRGDQSITRYEMAQMVAKALANRASANTADKSAIDKLAAEFGDELSTLGVRVANLEKKVDNVTWDGHARYDYVDSYKGKAPSTTKNKLRLQLNMHAQVNDMWRVNGRLETNYIDASAGTDGTAGGSGELKVKTINAQTRIGTTTVTLGRFDEYDDVTDGMIIDTRLTGAELLFKGKQGYSLKLAAGRVLTDLDESYLLGLLATDPATYIAAEATKTGSKWDLGIGYHNYNFGDFKSTTYFEDGTTKVESYGASAKYKYGKSFARVDYNRGMHVAEGKGANGYVYTLGYAPTNKFTFMVQYMNLPAFTKINQTYFVQAGTFQQGWNIGYKWKLQKNIDWTVQYFMGKDKDKADGSDTLDVFFSRLQFKF